VRNLVKAVRCALLARAKLAGAFAGDVFEHAAERAEARPAGLEGDVDDGRSVSRNSALARSMRRVSK
jgi:hypothetical protein